MRCLLWGSCSDAIHYSELELTRDTLCIALTGEPWGVCCECPVVMQYIIPTLNSRRTPYVSPHGRAMGFLLWGSCSNAIHCSDFELTWDSPCIALMGEPWGVCCEGSVVMQNIHPTFVLTGDTPRIALTDEPWGFCSEGPAVMQYINPTLTSQGTPHASPLRLSHGVSVVRVL